MVTPIESGQYLLKANPKRQKRTKSYQKSYRYHLSTQVIWTLVKSCHQYIDPETQSSLLNLLVVCREELRGIHTSYYRKLPPMSCTLLRATMNSASSNLGTYSGTMQSIGRGLRYHQPNQTWLRRNPHHFRTLLALTVHTPRARLKYPIIRRRKDPSVCIWRGVTLNLSTIISEALKLNKRTLTQTFDKENFNEYSQNTYLEY